jgi:hypothetical protein
MESFRGQLRYGGTSLFDELRGEVEFHPGLGWAPKGPWSGTFLVPDGGAIQAGGPYELVLKDGRTGRVLVRRSVVAFDRPAVAEFLGAGPLR